MLAPCRPCRGGNTASDSGPAEDDPLGVLSTWDPPPLLPRLIGGLGSASGPRHAAVVTAGARTSQVVSELGVPAQDALGPVLLDVWILFERRADARGQAIEGQLGLLSRPDAGSPASNQQRGGRDSDQGDEHGEVDQGPGVHAPSMTHLAAPGGSNVRS